MDTNVALAGPSQFQFSVDTDVFLSTSRDAEEEGEGRGHRGVNEKADGPELYKAEVPMLFLQPGRYCVATRCSIRCTPTEVSRRR